MTDTADELRITDNPVAHHYEAWLGDKLAGVSVYRLVDDRIVFEHTEVDPDVEGMGIGSRLARGALDDVRLRGLKLGVECPFIAAWLKRHPDYADMVAD